MNKHTGQTSLSNGCWCHLTKE